MSRFLSKLICGGLGKFVPRVGFELDVHDCLCKEDYMLRDIHRV